MPYGIIKVDTITFTDAGVDKSIQISGLVQNPTFSGNVTCTGTISGVTVTGTVGAFTTVSGITVTGNTAGFTTVTGTTITGTTVNAVSGVFTTQVSGAIITGNTGQFTNLTGQSAGFTTVTGTTITGTTINAASGVFTTRISGATITGNTAGFTTITGTTITGTTVNAVSGVFTTQVSGATITGTSFGVGTGGIRFADGNTQTGTISTATFATITGAQTFTGGQRGSVVTIAYSTGIALNLSSGNNFQITLTGNTTLQNPTSLSSGQAGVITIIQGSSGNTMSFATGWQYPGGSGSIPGLTAVSGAVDLLVYYVKDTSSAAFRLVQDVKA